IYFIEKSFQTNFILKFCILVVFGGLLTMGILYLLGIGSTTVSIINSRVIVRSTADFLLPILIQTIAVVTILVGLGTILVTLFVSHKIAGPLHRLKKVIEKLQEGDVSEDFHIRTGDQLKDLADGFNQMIRNLRFNIQQFKDHLLVLKEKLDSISDSESVEHKRLYLSELRNIVEELNRITQRFKT
ncbi:MAG: methyl-accepting chemotaxis protein, partial [Candidatus Omnitrophica bacterium]|nr:methyl-accepting chemotaxis protein [Candidatus Omnitrophota bacterium]